MTGLTCAGPHVLVASLADVGVDRIPVAALWLLNLVLPNAPTAGNRAIVGRASAARIRKWDVWSWHELLCQRDSAPPVVVVSWSSWTAFAAVDPGMPTILAKYLTARASSLVQFSTLKASAGASLLLTRPVLRSPSKLYFPRQN